MDGLILLAAEASSSVMDSGVISGIVDAAKQVIGIMTTPPLGVFITIGVIGSVAGLVATIVSMVRHG